MSATALKKSWEVTVLKVGWKFKLDARILVKYQKIQNLCCFTATTRTLGNKHNLETNKQTNKLEKNTVSEKPSHKANSNNAAGAFRSITSRLLQQERRTKFSFLSFKTLNVLKWHDQIACWPFGFYIYLTPQKGSDLLSLCSSQFTFYRSHL